MLEVCVDSLESAIIASENGADRLEICSCLVLGGLTPTYGLVKLVKERVKIPIHILIRPRQGDFVYNEEEVQTMIQNIKMFRDLGVNGIVIGALNQENSLDGDTLKRLIEVSGDLHLTFHRAFDQVKEPHEIVQQLINYGFKTILTSGLKATALDGQKEIIDLFKSYGNKICIMPGSGININTFPILKKNLSNLKWYHLSSKKLKLNSKSNLINVGSSNSQINDEIQNQVFVTDGDQLKKIKQMD